MKINPTKTISDLLTTLAFVIDLQEHDNFFHAWRVAILSASFAQDTPEHKKLKDIFYASLLHDVGGVEFSHHIIYYLKRKDKASRNLLLAHPIIGAQLISNIPQMTPVAKLILDHHEWINGTGYPRAKMQKNITPGSQFIRIADSIDIVLQTGRCFKLQGLKDKMSLNIDKEYSKELFNLAFDILKRHDFFYKIYQHHSIPLIFKEIKDLVGPIKILSKIDAIGTTLEVIAQIIDMKHPYASGHSLRVSHYAMASALAMELNHDEVTYIKWAGLIHDIGKINIPRRILDKPGHLSPKEFHQIKNHAILTSQVMDMLTSLQESSLITASHHEYFDGSGYPLGLKGNQICLGARILSICDAFDAMTSNRPYRKPLSPEAACREIKRCSGKQFDPEIVKHTLPLFRNIGL